MFTDLHLNDVNKDKWLPVIKQNRKSDIISGISGNHGYDPSIGYGAGEQKVAGMNYQIGSTDQIDGTLPRGALVDGRTINNEAKPKYRLRWYA